MTSQGFGLDMSMMFAVHDALRRELGRIARITNHPEDDPRHILQTAVGWEMFKSFLRVHHTAEDVSVWPLVERALAERPDDRAVLDAMEAEHAAIDPMLTAVDAALADRDIGPKILGDLVDALAKVLSAHLTHEEDAGLALIDTTLTPTQWKAFSDDHRARIGGDAMHYLPWLLDSADPQTTDAILGRMPEALKAAYANEWRTAYLDLDLWKTRQASTA
ncbi:hemerythrin domain-containing protein [Geodermatophilus sp. SYSU D01176]